VRRSAIAVRVICALVALQVVLAARQAVHPVTGRPIAQVMSHLGAGWLDRPEREGEEAPSKAIELIGRAEHVSGKPDQALETWRQARDKLVALIGNDKQGTTFTVRLPRS